MLALADDSSSRAAWRGPPVSTASPRKNFLADPRQESEATRMNSATPSRPYEALEVLRPRPGR
ncbi:hypothetical protein [Microbacterium aurum]